MGATRTKPWGYRHGTRNKFSKKHKSKGMPGTSRYLPVFKRGDYVDIVVDASIQKGMPYGFYHGRTGAQVSWYRPRSIDGLPAFSLHG